MSPPRRQEERRLLVQVPDVDLRPCLPNQVRDDLLRPVVGGGVQGGHVTDAVLQVHVGLAHLFKYIILKHIWTFIFCLKRILIDKIKSEKRLQ